MCILLCEKEERGTFFNDHRQFAVGYVKVLQREQLIYDDMVYWKLIMNTQTITFNYRL